VIVQNLEIILDPQIWHTFSLQAFYARRKPGSYEHSLKLAHLYFVANVERLLQEGSVSARKQYNCTKKP
jgi:hypothetical protein